MNNVTQSTWHHSEDKITSNRPRVRLLAALIAGLSTMPAFAGDIVGLVSDPDMDRFIEGASIRVDGQQRRVSTDRAGRFTIRDLPAGQYHIVATAGGFQESTTSVQVPETGSVNVDIDLRSSYARIEEVVVTGSRMSQLFALQRKRSAESIIDAVSADGVGKLPDFNVAEAIQRLPGLSVEIDQGEGRYPIVRGIDSNLNNVTIDGNLVGAPEGGGRRVALDVIPSDLVSAVEVVKAVTPDLDGNAVGGNINIVTRSAFDVTDPFAYVSARAGYNEKSGRAPYGGSAVWGSRLGDNEKLGVVLASSYYIRRYESDLLGGLDWSEFAPTRFAPEGMRLFDYDIERERIGLNANIEYRSSDEILWYLRSIFNEFTDEEQRHQLDLDMGRGDQTAISDTVVSNSEGRASREYRQNNQTQRLTNMAFGGEFRRGDLDWDLSYTFSHAEEITPLRIDWEFRSPGDAFPNTVDVSRLFFDVDAGQAIDNPENYPFRRVRRRSDAIEEDIHSFKADLRIDRNFGYLKFGGKFSTRDKFQDRTNDNFEDATAFTLADTGLFMGTPADFFEGRYTLGPRLDYAGLENLFVTRPELFEANPEGSALDSTGSDYQITEDLIAAYGMASVDIRNWTLLAGARVEYTDAVYDAYALDLPAADPLNPGIPTRQSIDYLDVLPSVHVTYRPDDNIVVRGAWTNTIGRPNFSSIVPTLEIEDLEGSAGNPELDPFESMGLDLSVEYYFQPTGILSAGVFYKDIDNPIYGRRVENTVFQGFDLDVLSQPANADSGSLLGLELNVERQFVDLPGALSGLGASANLTFIESEVDVFGREDDDLPFFRQPDRLANVALFYAVGGFEGRIAMSYRDAYLQGIGGNTDEDVYMGERTQIDLKLSYDVTDRLSVFGEVQNVNDEPLRDFQGVPGRLAGQEIYSWTTLFGANYSF